MLKIESGYKAMINQNDFA